MSSKQLAQIPSYRRDLLFAEISKKVREVEAVDRSLAGIGEGMAVDECLEEIVDAVASEMQMATKLCQRRRAKARAVVAAYLACPSPQPLSKPRPPTKESRPMQQLAQYEIDWPAGLPFVRRPSGRLILWQGRRL